MAKTNSRKSKTVAANTDLVTVNMATEVAQAEDTALSELLAMLADPSAPSADEVIEVAAPAETLVDAIEALVTPAEPEHTSFADAVGASEPVVEAEISDEDIAAAVSGAESVEAMINAATPHAADGSVTDDTPDVASDDAVDTPAESAAPVEAKPKKVPVPRKHYTNKADRIVDRLGEALPEFTVLTLDDAAGALDEESLKAKMGETMDLIRGMSKKKQNRAGFLMEFVSGKKAKLNSVMERAIKLLAKDGFLTTGKDGNYLADLLSVPYSPAAARAMGGNTIAVLEDLKLIVADGKGKFIANDESLLLAKVTELMTAPAPAGVVEDEVEPEAAEA